MKEVKRNHHSTVNKSLEQTIGGTKDYIIIVRKNEVSSNATAAWQAEK